MAYLSVFSQIIKQIPRTEFESSVHRHRGNRGVRTLDCWTWFGALLFGQLSRNDSVRAVERVFGHGQARMQHLGFGEVCRSTLADANRTRPTAILKETFDYVLARARTVAPRKGPFRFHGDVTILDSSTIRLCLNLCPWARFHHNKGACKLHTAIDVAGELPQFAVITPGLVHDVRVARGRWKAFLTPASLVVFDKAYVDYAWFNTLTQHNISFVTRIKNNCQFKVVESRPTNRTRGHICDQTIYLKSQRGQRYHGTLRRISYRDPDTGKRLTFLTNRFDLAVQTICDLYKARWQVELFFKTLKQHLKIRKFLGTSENAVSAQILVALIAYLLVMLLRYAHKSRISIPETMALLAVLLLLNMPLALILKDLPTTTRHPSDPQLSFSF